MLTKKTAARLLAALSFVACAASAQAAVIASYTSGIGLLCGGCPQPDPTTQYAAISIFGTSVHNAPAATGDTLIVDLAGAPLAQVAAWFTDGVDTSVPAWIGIELGYAPTYSLTMLGEHPSTIGDLAGNTISGVRITLDQLCFDTRDGIDPCNNDPAGNRIGYTGRYTLEFFDAAVGVPEPGSAALCIAALFAALAGGRRRGQRSAAVSA
jgi:hypothetical protein